MSGFVTGYGRTEPAANDVIVDLVMIHRTCCSGCGSGLPNYLAGMAMASQKSDCLP